MKVSELIEKLSKVDSDLKVFIEGYEGGYDDICKEDYEPQAFVMNVHDEWYYGKHEIADPNEIEFQNVEFGIVIK